MAELAGPPKSHPRPATPFPVVVLQHPAEALLALNRALSGQRFQVIVFIEGGGT
jgi:hypothetical protein